MTGTESKLDYIARVLEGWTDSDLIALEELVREVIDTRERAKPQPVYGQAGYDVRGGTE